MRLCFSETRQFKLSENANFKIFYRGLFVLEPFKNYTYLAQFSSNAVSGHLGIWQIFVAVLL
jgi:hypothetical protein